MKDDIEYSNPSPAFSIYFNSTYPKLSDPVNLIQISLNDFKAAEILFNNKLYSQAIWSLEQSLEKAIKAILVCHGNVKTEKELKDIGHDPTSGELNLMESLIENLKEIGNDEEFEEIKPKLIEVFNEYKDIMIKFFELVGETGSNKIEFVRIFNGDYQYLLQSAEQLKEIKSRIDTYRRFILQPIIGNTKNEIDYVMKKIYCVFDFINSIKLTSLVILKIRIRMYEYILTILAFPFNNELMSKLRYHLPELNEDIILVYYSRKVIEIIKDTKTLENLNELINYFKGNQISN